MQETVKFKAIKNSLIFSNRYTRDGEKTSTLKITNHEKEKKKKKTKPQRIRTLQLQFKLSPHQSMNTLLIRLLACLTLFFPHLVASYHEYSFSKHDLQKYSNQTKDLFYWSLDQYFEHAYPFDELNPIDCTAKTRNFADPQDTVTNDVLGNFSLSLIDSLTTLIVFQDVQNFTKIVELLTNDLDPHWQIDSTIQSFEAIIRIIGSFLSAHIHIVDQNFWDSSSKTTPQYKDVKFNLLYRAEKLADIILETYKTPSGLPLPRVNLKNGLQGIAEFDSSNNPVAMGCPFLEFHLLSILTSNDKYKIVTQYAYDRVIHELTSELNLIPHSVDPVSLQTLEPYTNVGASIDSIYEYSLKNAILFNNETTMQVYRDLIKSINVYSEEFWFYKTVDIHNMGSSIAFWIDSLSAFFPGVLVLNGDVDNATYKNMFYWKLWNYYGGIPERWNFQSAGNSQIPPEVEINNQTDLERAMKRQRIDSIVNLEWYPLRPEFIESTYYLYQATRDPMYLNIGKQVLHDLQTRFKCKCGLCGIQNIKTGEMQKRTESFVFSETLKYLFLLFNHELQPKRFDNVIFNTEAHPLYVPKKMYQHYTKTRFFNDTYFSNLQDYWDLWKESTKSEYNLFVNNNGGNATCPVSEKFMILPFLQNNKNSKTFMNSPILNDREKLFEFDRQYHTQLVYPDWLIEQRGNDTNFQMEVNKEFIDVYSPSSILQCKLSKEAAITGDSFALEKQYMENPAGATTGEMPSFGQTLKLVLGTNRQYAVENNQLGSNFFKSLIGCNLYIITEGGSHKARMHGDAMEMGNSDTKMYAFLTRVDDQHFEPDQLIYVNKTLLMPSTKTEFEYDEPYYEKTANKLHGEGSGGFFNRSSKKGYLKTVLTNIKDIQKIISVNGNGQVLVNNGIFLQNVYAI